MFKRLFRIVLFPIAFLILIPGVLQWVIMGRNYGWDLLGYSVTGEWESL